MKAILILLCVILMGCTKPDIKPEKNAKAMVNREQQLNKFIVYLGDSENGCYSKIAYAGVHTLQNLYFALTGKELTVNI